MKYTVEMNDKLSAVLDDLAARDGLPKAHIVRRALTLLKLITDAEADGYECCLAKDGVIVKRIVVA